MHQAAFDMFGKGVPYLLIWWEVIGVPLTSLILWTRGYRIKRIFMTRKYWTIGVANRGDRVGSTNLKIEKNVLVCPCPCLTMEWAKEIDV